MTIRQARKQIKRHLPPGGPLLTSTRVDEILRHALKVERRHEDRLRHAECVALYGGDRRKRYTRRELRLQARVLREALAPGTEMLVEGKWFTGSWPLPAIHIWPTSARELSWYNDPDERLPWNWHSCRRDGVYCAGEAKTAAEAKAAAEEAMK